MKIFHLFNIIVLLSIIGFIGYKIATYDSTMPKEKAQSPISNVRDNLTDNVEDIKENVTEKIKENVEKITPKPKDKNQEEENNSDTLEILLMGEDKNRIFSNNQTFAAKITIDRKEEKVIVTPLVQAPEQTVPVFSMNQSYPAHAHAEQQEAGTEEKIHKREDFEHYIELNMEKFSSVLEPVLKELKQAQKVENLFVESNQPEVENKPQPIGEGNNSVNFQFNESFNDWNQLFQAVVNSISLETMRELNSSIETNLQGKDLLSILMSLHKIRDNIKLDINSEEKFALQETVSR